MRRFQFTLAAVLTLRESEQEKALEAYAEAMQRRVQAEETCARGQARLGHLQDAVASGRTARFPATEQQAFFQSLLDAEAQLRHSRSLLRREEANERQKLRELLLAKGKVDVLNKLKEKRQQAHEFEEVRLQEKEIDDMISARRRRPAMA